MDLSDRKATLSLQLAKAWFVLSLLIAAYGVYSDGFGRNAIEIVIPVLALIAMWYRYPWGRFLVLGLLLFPLAYFTYATVAVTMPVAKLLYRELVGLSPPQPQGPFTLLFVLLVGPLKVGFFAWLFIDILRNERVKRYFASSKELASGADIDRAA
jgi:uncharacterized SAM-binding protein YcdF (DUF218 family)